MQSQPPWGGLPLIALAALTLPWLNPFAAGPSAGVEPWLFCLAASALVLALGPAASGMGRWLVLGALLPLWLTASSGAVSPEIVGVVGAVFIVASLAAVAAGQRDAARMVAQAWLAAALLSSAIGLCQYFGVAARFAPWMNSPGFLGEAFGNLRQRNQYASLMALGGAALWWLWRSGWSTRTVALCLLPLAVAVATSLSRTGGLQWLMVAALGVAWAGRDRRWTAWGLALLSTLALGVATLLLPALLRWGWGVDAEGLAARFAAPITCGTRPVLWSNVLHLITQKPWLGWGWGGLDAAHYLTLYPGARFCDILDNAHNLPLHIAVEAGVPAAAVLVLAVLWGVWRGRPWREAEAGHQMAWTVLAVIGLHSLLEYPLWYGPFQMALGLALGLLLGPRAGVGSAAPTAASGSASMPLMRPATRWLWAALMAVSCLVATWDYRRVSQLYLPVEARWPSLRQDTAAAVQDSWLFASQRRFAEVTTLPLTPATAGWLHANAEALLRYSPEPRVIERLIDSARLLGLEDEAQFHIARYRAAFPAEYARWAAR